jgi:hypothetical protein
MFPPFVEHQYPQGGDSSSSKLDHANEWPLAWQL